MTRRTLLASAAMLAIVSAVVLFVPLHSMRAAPTFPAPIEDPGLKFENTTQWRAYRTAALRRAKVWRDTDPSRTNLGSNPPDSTGLLSSALVSCRFHPQEATGTTPKFRCALANGEVVKVKYGARTGEVHAEVAAARLLRALGFGADDMYLVSKVRCYGCPRFPFRAMWTLDRLHARAIADDVAETRYTDFEWVSVERPRAGLEIEYGDDKGWRWDELAAIEPDRGATRAEVDALRLAALFLSHWDNKASNQGLVCEATLSEAAEHCERPFAFIQDLGATFGPNKVDLDSWIETPIWSERSSCTVSMRALPYDGATFVDVQITEAGRALFGRQVQRLTDTQIESLFQGARFGEFSGGAPAQTVAAWARAFKAKVQEVTEAGPCPESVRPT